MEVGEGGERGETGVNAQHTTKNTQCERQFCSPKFAHVGLPLDPRGSPKETLGSYTFIKFENRSRTTCPDSSNHSLYLIKVFSLLLS